MNEANSAEADRSEEKAAGGMNLSDTVDALEAEGVECEALALDAAMQEEQARERGMG